MFGLPSFEGPPIPAALAERCTAGAAPSTREEDAHRSHPRSPSVSGNKRSNRMALFPAGMRFHGEPLQQLPLHSGPLVLEV